MRCTLTVGACRFRRCTVRWTVLAAIRHYFSRHAQYFWKPAPFGHAQPVNVASCLASSIESQPAKTCAQRVGVSRCLVILQVLPYYLACTSGATTAQRVDEWRGFGLPRSRVFCAVAPCSTSYRILFFAPASRFGPWRYLSEGCVDPACASAAYIPPARRCDCDSVCIYIFHWLEYGRHPPSHPTVCRYIHYLGPR